MCVFFFFQAEDGIRDLTVTGVQTCALPISEVRPNKHFGAVESRRRDSDNCERMLVYINRGSHDLRVRTEISAPKVVAQDDVRGGIRAMFVTGMKEPA